MAVISEFAAAVNQICAERGIDPEKVYEAIEEAVLAAYKKDYGGGDEMKVEVDRETGQIHVIAVKEVVEDVEEEESQISLEEAVDIEPDLKIGDQVEIEASLEGFGRIAAQTAKQVILQNVRESEKEALVSEFEGKIGMVMTGLVQRMAGPTAVVEIGKATAYMPPDEQIPNEFYKIGERYKFLLKEIKDNQEIIVSRGSPEFLIELFKLEVPEMESGIIEVKACAREAGSRSKLAVVSNQDGIDAIGSCVGQKGVRIANVMAELGEEKIDIIEWDENLEQFVANALGPAQVESVEIDNGLATVSVADDQLSLAIGKDGQNVRLAAKLTELKIDITAPSLKEAISADKSTKGMSREGVELSTRVTNALEDAGIALEKLVKMSEDEIAEIKGIGPASMEEIKEYIESVKNSEKPTEESDDKEPEESDDAAEKEVEKQEKETKEKKDAEEEEEEEVKKDGEEEKESKAEKEE